MNIEISKEIKLYELLPIGMDRGKSKIVVGRKKRLMLGRSQACDLILAFPDITAIHAVIEVQNDKFKIYDMNSRNGTYLNGKKIIVSDFKIGDVLKFGLHEFKFQDYEKDIELPPVLDMLDPQLPPVINTSRPSLPKAMPRTMDKQETGVVSKVLEEVAVPRVEYPLAQDPQAEFSEYIFEDVEVLFPIFKYKVVGTSAEVIIIYQDRIYSVDYLPNKNGVYRLVGKDPKSNDIEYAYLGKEEKVNFVEINNGEIIVHPLFGYECFSLADDLKLDNRRSNGPIVLRDNDILRFSKGDIQVFVRGTQLPPSVKPAPIFRRDKDLRKFLFLAFALVFLFLGSMHVFKVDEDLDKDKLPERIATILYQKKLVVSKTKAIEKTEVAPKEIQKAKAVEPIVKEKQPEKPVEKVVEKVIPKKVEGVKDITKKVQPVKKVAPIKAPVNKVAPRVTPTPVVKKAAAAASAAKPTPKAVVKAPSQGHVDTYKSFDFSSTISSLVSKGGNTKNIHAKTAQSSDIGLSGLESGGEESATLTRAKVSQHVGSLTGTTSGSLDATRGVEGLVNKRSVYTVGIPSRMVIRGSMDPDIIRRILLDHSPQFRHCYQRVLDQSAKAFDGVVPLIFTIGASGHVTSAGVSEETSMPGGVKSCVINVLRGIKFPEPMGGGVVEVKQPLNFYQNSN